MAGQILPKAAALKPHALSRKRDIPIVYFAVAFCFLVFIGRAVRLLAAFFPAPLLVRPTMPQKEKVAC